MEIEIGFRVKHPSFGEGMIIDENSGSWIVFFRDEDREIAKSFEGFEVLDYGKESVINSGPTLDIEGVKAALKSVLLDISDIQHPLDLGEKWEGGTMILQPENKELKSKEIPIETFFHKIVMMRDRLRVLEQNVNSHKVLTDQDKVHLQQYITRCYGSMTTFNVFFADKDDYFSGS